MIIWTIMIWSWIHGFFKLLNFIRLQRDLFPMIHQLCPLTFFITFMSVETKWFLSLYDLNHKRKIANIPFDRLEPKHIIQCELVTCSRYYDHRMQSFAKLLLKDYHFQICTRLFFHHRVPKPCKQTWSWTLIDF